MLNQKTRFLRVLCFTLTIVLLWVGGVVASTKVHLVDKYGNITLELLTEDLLNAGYEFGDIVLIEIDGHKLEAPFVTAYSDVDTGSVLVRGPGGVGSNPLILAINMGNFSATYDIKEGDSVQLKLVEKAGYLTEWTIRQLERSNNRDDYASDEIFANFRGVNLGDMAKGVYYRASSPANNELGRAAYVDAFIAQAKIHTVINLADSQEEMMSYLEQDDFNSPHYKKLYEENRVILLSMGVDFKSADFQARLKQGLEFMIANPGPYLVHCNEGKDRAGFVAGVLEALMGATAIEIKEDYMVTYSNYYGVEYGSEQYEKIAESNILESLREIAGLPKGADLSDVNLVKAAEDYLTKIGLTAEQIRSLKGQLSKAPSSAA